MSPEPTPTSSCTPGPENKPLGVDLTPFCGSEEERPFLRTPVRLGEWTYAGNGRILVRVPAQEWSGALLDPELWSSSPSPADVLKPIDTLTDWRPMPAMEACPNCANRGTYRVLCEWCGGETQHTCDCGHTHPCEACDGLGYEVKRCQEIRLRLGAKGFACWLSQLLQPIRPLEWAAPDDAPETAAYFRFGTGAGAIMPIVPPTGGTQ